MLTSNTLYQILAGIVLGIWCLYVLFSFIYPRLKPYRLLILVIFAIVAVIIRVFFTNTVYIITDDDQIQQKLLLFPYRYPLSNGHYTLVAPQPGLTYDWLINNGTNQAWLETVVYGGDANAAISRLSLPAYSATKITQINYVFTPPPKTINSKKTPVTVGWLHR